MFRLRKLVPFLFFLFSLQARAEVLVLNQTVQRSRVSLVGEFSQLTVEGQAIQGQGLALQYDYGFSDRLILEGFISTSLSNEGSGMQSSFTGFGGYALYALLGN